ALKGFDAAFDAAPDGNERRGAWRSARSKLVDLFFSVDGSGPGATFHERAVSAALPGLVDTIAAQLLAHCPDRSDASRCPWARQELPQDIADFVSGPL